MEEALSQIGDKKVAIFTHPGPDPDAMGSCLGMQWILESKFGIMSDLFMQGDYSSRRQNTAMVNILDIKFKKVEEYIENRDQYGSAIVVDSTPKRVPPEISGDIKVVIDHHSVKVDPDEYDFIINRKVGSCCTIIFDMMTAMECVPPKNEKGLVIATAMLEGIRSDTDMYRREDTTKGDFDASAILFDLADMDLINQIERCRLPRYHFELRAAIIEPGNSEIVEGATFIACAGFLSTAKVASLPILADEVMNDMEGISTSIIFAIVEDRIELSMRSNEVSLEVNRFLQKHFGDYAGAKYGSGGASIPLGVFGMPNPPEELKKNIYETTKSVIMTVLSRDVKSE